MRSFRAMTEPLRIVRCGVGTAGVAWLVDDDGRLRQLAAGPAWATATADLPAMLYPQAYPTIGDGDPFRATPLVVTHANGMLTTRLRVVNVDEADGHLDVVCRDELLVLTVTNHVRAHHDCDVVEQWVTIEHDEPGPITIADVDALCLQLMAAPDAEVCQFGGSGWADEWAWTTERLTPGTKLFDSYGGVQPHLQRSPVLLISPDGRSAETDVDLGVELDVEVAGTVLGLSIAWGGNTRFALDVRPLAGQESRSLRVRAGANSFAAPYVLDPGAVFRTPSVLWTWSTEGRGAVSDRFHRYTRAHALRDPGRTRAIVSNNWEATFFDFDEDRLRGLIERAAAVGAELFLLDDGWFGDRYPRDHDGQGLGDWMVDERKLPNGLAAVSAATIDAGLRFGIWVEPEMVNERSELYETHPEWVLRDARTPLEHRQQLLLDPLQPDVAAFIDGVVADAIAAGPGTSYVKWDANRPITDSGSSTLPADRQANVWTDLVWATWARMAAVAEAHPDVDLMLCASGGGRVDHGSLRWFHEFWTSDNTDPVTRVAMQWACSHFFPASAMAAHVTRWGERPMAFACAVALWGRFGIDLDLTALSDDDLAVVERAVVVAKRIRDVVQHGRLHRLVSPVDGPHAGRRAAVSYVSADRSRAVVLAYELEAGEREAAPDLLLRGLDPEATYDLVALPLTGDAASDVDVAGATGVRDGDALPWPLTEPLTASVLELTRRYRSHS